MDNMTNQLGFQFLKELGALLDKYKVDLRLNDEYEEIVFERDCNVDYFRVETSGYNSYRHVFNEAKYTCNLNDIPIQEDEVDDK